MDGEKKKYLNIFCILDMKNWSNDWNLEREVIDSKFYSFAVHVYIDRGKSIPPSISATHTCSPLTSGDRIFHGGIGSVSYSAAYHKSIEIYNSWRLEDRKFVVENNARIIYAKFIASSFSLFPYSHASPRPLIN